MAMNRTQFARLLQEGLNTVWGLEYNSYPEEWKQVFKVESSKKAFEEDQLVTGFGAAQIKSEGAAFAYDEAMEAWTSRYDHKTVALGFKISQELIEDNLYMQTSAKYARALARSMQHTREIYGAAVLNNGFGTFLIGDGQPLFSASHPLSGGGVASNLLGTPADISEQAIEDLLVQIRKTKDDRGIPVALKPTDVIIPPDLEFVTCRLLDSVLRTNTADNDVNAINKKGIFGRDPVIVTRLTDTNAWFIKTDCPDGLKSFDRIAVQTKFDEDFNTGDYRFKARARYSHGASDWRGCFGSSGAS